MEPLAEELQTLMATLKDHDELRRIVEHPLIRADAKLKLLRGVFNAALSEPVYSLLHLLFRRKRADYVLAIAERYQALAQEQRGEISVEIETTHPLEESELNAWRERLGAATGKKAIPVVKVNPQLIAGYRVKLGDRVLDATLSGALRQFDLKLKAAGAF